MTHAEVQRGRDRRELSRGNGFASGFCFALKRKGKTNEQEKEQREKREQREKKVT